MSQNFRTVNPNLRLMDDSGGKTCVGQGQVCCCEEASSHQISLAIFTCLSRARRSWCRVSTASSNVILEILTTQKCQTGPQNFMPKSQHPRMQNPIGIIDGVEQEVDPTTTLDLRVAHPGCFLQLERNPKRAFYKDSRFNQPPFDVDTTSSAAETDRNSHSCEDQHEDEEEDEEVEEDQLLCYSHTIDWFGQDHRALRRNEDFPCQLYKPPLIGDEFQATLPPLLSDTPCGKTYGNAVEVLPALLVSCCMLWLNSRRLLASN